MKIAQIILISCFTLCAGIIFFCYYHEVIIFNTPKIYSRENNPVIHHEKKIITLYFWQQNAWQKEETEILWSHDPAISAQYIIRSWLNLLDEENINNKKVSLQSALLAPSGELYISFDRSPFDKESAIYQKIIWIEGLLKTLKNNNLEFSFINFLVHHKPINDTHLDFTQSWPGIGFLNTESA